MADSKYHIDSSNRDEIELAWRSAIFARSKEMFNKRWQALLSLVRTFGVGFDDYLKKNWFECRDMWATHLRTKTYTAGNTTSNRLEATWGQMKKLINLNMTLDHCVNGILLYQNATMRELRGDLTHCDYQTRFNPRHPDAVHQLANSCSPYVCNKIVAQFREYERNKKVFRVLWKSQEEAKLFCRGVEYRVNRGACSCSCDYYLSWRLPCAHVIYVSIVVEGATTLPDDVLHSRWSYNSTSAMDTTLKTTIENNKDLRKLVGPATRVDESVDLPKSFLVRNHDRKRVEFKKLRRGERSAGKILVQSDVEKHNIVLATLAPIINDLEQSSSEVFFKKLAMVEVACKGLTTAFGSFPQTAAKDKNSDAEVCDDDPVEDVVLVEDKFDPESFSEGPEWDFEEELEKLEKEINAPYKGKGDGGEVVVDTRAEEKADVGRTLGSLNPECNADAIDVAHGDEANNKVSSFVNGDNNSVGNGDDVPHLTKASDTSADIKGTSTIMKKKSRKDTQTYLVQIKLPPSVESSRSNSRKRNSSKKLRHPRLSVEVTVEEYNNGVQLSDVVVWLERTNNHDKTEEVLRAYPVVRNKASDGMCKVEVDTDKVDGSVTSVGVVFGQAAVTNALTTLRTDIKLSKMVYPRKRYALRQLPDPTPYHECVLWAMQDFYRLKSQHQMYKKAMTWLDRNWTDDKFDTDCFSAPGVSEFEMAKEIMSKLKLTSLSSYISFTRSGGVATSVTMTELIETIPNREWVKDSPISVVLQLACMRHGRAIFLESTVRKVEQWKMPKPNERDVDYLVAPCNSANAHWTLIVIDIRASKAFVYDPLNTDDWLKSTRIRAKEVIIPAINYWRTLKFGKDVDFPRWQTPTLIGPEQPDKINCGVFAAAMGWAFLTGEGGWQSQRGEMPIHAGTTLRLKMLYHLICAPEMSIVIPENQAAVDTSDTDMLLDKMIEAKIIKSKKAEKISKVKK